MAAYLQVLNGISALSHGGAPFTSRDARKENVYMGEIKVAIFRKFLIPHYLKSAAGVGRKDALGGNAAGNSHDPLITLDRDQLLCL